MAAWPGPITIGEIPQSDGLVSAGRGQGMPIWGKRHPVNRVGVAGEWMTEWPGPVTVADIPQDDGLIETGGQCQLAVRMKSYGADFIGMGKKSRGLRVGDIPEPRTLVASSEMTSM